MNELSETFQSEKNPRNRPNKREFLKVIIPGKDMFIIFFFSQCTPEDELRGQNIYRVKKIFIFLIILLVKHHQLQPNIILIMFRYKTTPRSLNFIKVNLFQVYICHIFLLITNQILRFFCLDYSLSCITWILAIWQTWLSKFPEMALWERVNLGRQVR